MSIDALLEKPCWIVDILPEQVPEDSPGQYFPVEKFYLRDSSLRRKQLNMILKLNCFYELALATEDEEIRNPAPTFWQERLGQEYLSILVGKHALITADHTDTYMSVFTADEKLLEMIRKLAAAEGLFMWKGNN